MLQLGGNGGMGMLKSIALENYKCFKDKTEIDIAPLTVLCGVNSSGKSSILKSLLMMKQSFENNPSKGEILFAGKDVDNGTFKDIVFNGNPVSFTIEDTFEINNCNQSEYDKYNFTSDISDYKDLKKIYSNIVGNKNVFFQISFQVEVSGNTKPNTPFQDLRNNIKTYYIKVEVFSKNKSFQNKSCQLLCSQIKFDLKSANRKIYKVTFDKFPLINTERDEKTITEVLDDCTCYYDGIKVVKMYTNKPSKNYSLNNFLPNVYALFDIIASQFNNIKHMSPLRLYPSRRYFITHSIKETNPSGEDFAQIIAQYGTETKEHFFIDHNNQYDNISDSIFIKDKKTLQESIQIWSQYLNMGEVDLSPKDEMVKVNVDSHNILDVGFGVSQSLPILVSGLHLAKQSTMIYEQPEIHLHPKAQMGMADFLLSLSLNGRNIIVETHSDHIINRIVRRVMEDKKGKLNSLVKIYFVQGYNLEHPICKDIKINSVDGIIDAPDEFFTQFGAELMKIAKIGMQNSKEGVIW